MVFSFFWTQKEKRWLVRGGDILSQTEGYLIIAKGSRGTPGQDHCFEFSSGLFPSLSPARKSLLSVVFFPNMKEKTFPTKKSFLKREFRLQNLKLLTPCMHGLKNIYFWDIFLVPERVCLCIAHRGMVCLPRAKELLIVRVRADNLSFFSRTGLQPGVQVGLPALLEGSSV